MQIKIKCCFIFIFTSYFKIFAFQKIKLPRKIKTQRRNTCSKWLWLGFAHFQDERMPTSLRGSYSLWWKAVEALFDGFSELFCCLWSIFHFIFDVKSLLQENVSFYFYFYSSFLPQIFMGEDARTPNKNWWGLLTPYFSFVLFCTQT